MSTASLLSVKSAPYGKHNGHAITEYTLSNAAPGGVDVKIIDYGCILTACMQPDRNGVKKDIAIGYGTLPEWEKGMAWFNTIMGRYSNRIAAGKFKIDGVQYQAEVNNLGNHLHGGAGAFDVKVMRSRSIQGSDSGKAYVGIVLEFVSPDGDKGYPGELFVQTTVKLFASNTLQFEYRAELTGNDSKSTIVNLTNHNYWNLAGNGQGTVHDHTLQVHADARTELDGKDTMIPTGRVLPIAGGPYDFNKPRTIGSRLDELENDEPVGGYDVNYVLNKSGVPNSAPRYMQPRAVGTQGKSATFFSRISHPSGRVMDVYSTNPGMQFYTSNWFNGKTVVGRGGVAYPKYGAVCFEPQTFPNAINFQEEYKKYSGAGILRPGEKYEHIVQHVFSTEAASRL